MRKFHLRCNRKTPQFQGLQQGEMRSKLGPTFRGWRDLTHTISKETQGSIGCDGGVELAHRAGGRIARVDKRLLTLVTPGTAFALARIECIKVVTAHVDLATHLQYRRHRKAGLAAGPPLVAQALASLIEGQTRPLGGQRGHVSAERGGRNPQWYLTDGANVFRDVLARFTITARGRLHQHTVLVTQIHRQAIELELGHVLDRCIGLH